MILTHTDLQVVRQEVLVPRLTAAGSVKQLQLLRTQQSLWMYALTISLLIRSCWLLEAEGSLQIFSVLTKVCSQVLSTPANRSPVTFLICKSGNPLNSTLAWATAYSMKMGLLTGLKAWPSDLAYDTSAQQVLLICGCCPTASSW